MQIEKNHHKLNSYQFKKQIGQGSSGKIYQVQHIQTGVQYALKKISLSSMDYKQRADSLQECKLLHALHHPNIIQFFDSFIEGNILIIVMELAEKGDLYHKVKQKRADKTYFSEVEIWRIAFQICQALQYIHRKNIIHRDIKTLNILVMKDETIKIGDLGVSKIFDSHQQNFTKVGTPLYLPPEMIQQRSYNFKVDMWSFGCVLYNICTLQPPFYGNNLIDLAIANIKPVFFKQFNLHKYFEELKSLIQSLLTKSPDKRPSANQIIESYFTTNIAQTVQTQDSEQKDNDKSLLPNRKQRNLNSQANNCQAIKQQQQKKESQKEPKIEEANPTNTLSERNRSLDQLKQNKYLVGKSQKKSDEPKQENIEKQPEIPLNQRQVETKSLYTEQKIYKPIKLKMARDMKPKICSKIYNSFSREIEKDQEVPYIQAQLDQKSTPIKIEQELQERKSIEKQILQSIQSQPPDIVQERQPLSCEKEFNDRIQGQQPQLSNSVEVKNNYDEQEAKNIINYQTIEENNKLLKQLQENDKMKNQRKNQYALSVQLNTKGLIRPLSSKARQDSVQKKCSTLHILSLLDDQLKQQNYISNQRTYSAVVNEIQNGQFDIQLDSHRIHKKNTLTNTKNSLVNMPNKFLIDKKFSIKQIE